MGNDRPRAKTGQAGGASRAAWVLPVIIILFIIGAALGFYFWTTSDPAYRFNKHLEKGLAALRASRVVSPEGTSIDPIPQAAAHQEFLLALEDGERAFGPTDGRLEEVYIVLVNFAVQDEDWKPAKEYGERLLSIQQKKYGQTHEYLVKTYEYLAKAYRGLKDEKGEEQALTQIVAINPDIWTKYNLAAFYLERKNAKMAYPHMRDVITENLQYVEEKRKAARPDEYQQGLQIALVNLKEYLRLLAVLGKKDEFVEFQAKHNTLVGDLNKLIKQQPKPTIPVLPPAK